MAGQPWRDQQLTPYFADAIRDVLGLVRCSMAGDEEGARVILRALREEPARMADACRVLAELCAELTRDPGWLDRLQHTVGGL